MLLRNLLILLVAFALTPAATGETRASGFDDLCEVLANIDQYEGRTVTVRGEARTDFAHITGVGDARCPITFLAFGPERFVESGMDQFWLALQRMRQSGGSVQLTARGVIASRADQHASAVLNVRTFSEVTYIPSP